MYIVCLTTKRKSKDLLPIDSIGGLDLLKEYLGLRAHAFTNEVEYHSDWQAFDTLEEAQELYRRLLNRKDLYTATICKPIESTEPTYLDEPIISKPGTDRLLQPLPTKRASEGK